MQSTGRHHRNKSMPYDRSVAADRPAANSSRRNTATGSTTPPSASSRRYGSRPSPVDSRRPVQGTTRHPRSRAFPSDLITAGNVATQPQPGRLDLPKLWS